MATKNQQPDEVERQVQSPDPQLYPIEELRLRKKILPTVFHGVCVQQGWNPGKSVTEIEFDLAITKFMGGGADHAAGR